jgi:hypothetical protein
MKDIYIFIFSYHLISKNRISKYTTTKKILLLNYDGILYKIKNFKKISRG